MLQELPGSLKEELLNYQFGGLVETINMLRENEDSEFVWEIV